MTEQEHLLMVAAEECAEVAQRLIKCARFGIDQVQPQAHGDGKTDTSTNPEGLTNRERVYREYFGLRATLGMAGFDAWDTSTHAREIEQAKAAKVQKYLDVSRGYGTLDVKPKKRQTLTEELFGDSIERKS